jgi:hypothetical protein
MSKTHQELLLRFALCEGKKIKIIVNIKEAFEKQDHPFKEMNSDMS